MPLVRIGITSAEITQVAPAAAVTPDHEVAVVGSLAVSAGGNADSTLKGKFPLNTPTLIPNRAAFDALGADGGTAYNPMRDMYAQANVPVAFIRTDDLAAYEATADPTAAERLAAVNALPSIPQALGIRPRYTMAPTLNYAVGVADGQPTAGASPISSPLDGHMETLESIAVVSCPPGSDGAASTTTNALAWSAANRGSHMRLVHVFPRQTVSGADDDMSGAVIGALIANERTRGVGANPNHRPLVTAGGVPRPALSNSYGQDTTDDASQLSVNGIIGVVRELGLRLWGNTVATDDDSSIERYIPVRRALDEVSRAMRRINRAALDLEVNEEMFTFVESRARQWLSGFQFAGGIASGDVTRNSELNTPEAALAGQAYFDVVITPRFPLRAIHFTILAARE